MTLISSLIKAILSVNTDTEVKTVAICGAADLGKTYLTKKLVAALEQKGVSAGHLTLDSYLMPRTKRVELGISGYEENAYNLAQAKSELLGYLSGKTLTYRTYDHAKGEACGEPIIIPTKSVLFVEGLHSMSSDLASLMDYSIFIDTDDETLKGIRHRADIIKRKQTVRFSKENLDSEFKAYKQHVAPYRDEANVVLTLTKEWQYRANIKKRTKEPLV